LSNPATFGGAHKPDWLPAPRGKSPEAMNARASQRAATIQHAIAVAVQARLLSHGFKDLSALAGTQLGISYSQLHKMMRGAAHMSLDHVAVLEERLGPLLEVQLAPK
jgi:hypothetical protein